MGRLSTESWEATGVAVLLQQGGPLRFVPLSISALPAAVEDDGENSKLHQTEEDGGSGTGFSGSSLAQSVSSCFQSFQNP